MVPLFQYTPSSAYDQPNIEYWEAKLVCLDKEVWQKITGKTYKWMNRFQYQWWMDVFKV